MDPFIIQIPDDGGFTMNVKEHEGMYMPPFVAGDPAKQLATVRDLSGTSDDVIVSAFPKSGTHWVWEMVSLMLSGRVENSHQSFLEFNPEIENLPPPHVYISHLRWHQLPLDFINKKGRIIRLLRDPKDIAVSFHPFLKKLELINYAGPWETYMPSFLRGESMGGSWFDHTLHWEKVVSEHPDYPIVTIYYEDLIKDCFGELKKLAKFLNVDCSDAFLSDITAKCSFDQMKTEKDEIDAEYSRLICTDGTNPFFRKGKVGDWKNTFTVAQSEMWDAVYAEKMKTSKHGLRCHDETRP